MNIIVAIKHIPSLLDELELNATGTDLDFDSVDFTLNEWDEQAIEEAVLIKEASGGTVTVLGVDLIEELDGVLHTALAKGADHVAKIVGDFEPGLDSHSQARLLAHAIKDLAPDIVLTGVQAPNDRDGQIAPMLAAHLGLPYVGVVMGVKVDNGTAIVHKEYSGGLMAEFAISLPMVVGVQAASQPPRYAPVSKIRQMAKTATIDELEVGDSGPGAGSTARKMAPPVSTDHAEMIEGDAGAVAERIVEIIKERGLL
ncbi:MAG: electron transfer flavoprotein subunit beta/FixA family protein [Anaerolineae bacterium]|nr:electron transfer flavoprotein subunit beta/FixA family protein [Anaerolineae bacterium]